MVKIKRWLAVALSGFLAVTALHTTELPLNPYALQAEAASADTTTFSTSNYSSTNISIKVQGKKLIFEDLPDEERFEKILVSLYSPTKGVLSNTKTYLSAKEAFTFPISGVANGTYHIQLYYYNGKSYTSYWYQTSGPVLIIDGESITFQRAMPYAKNVEIFSTRATGEDALAFYKKSDSLVDSDSEEIIEKAKSITNGIESNYEKVLAVHNWIANNIWYDYDYLNGKTQSTEYIASDVLKSKKTVCQGYADLAAALLRAIGIPAKVTNGYAMGIGSSGQWSEQLLSSKKTNHAWNEVYVDGRWVIFDCTWDTNNQYSNGKYSTGTGLSSSLYFDPTLECFSNTHYIIGQEEALFKKLMTVHKIKDQIELDAGTATSLWNIPVNANTLKANYKIQDEAFISIDPTGKVIGKQEGTTNVEVELSLGGNTASFQTSIIVNKGDGNIYYEAQEEIEEVEETPMPTKSPAAPVAPTPVLTPTPTQEPDVSELLAQVKPSYEEISIFYNGNVNTSAKILYYGVTDEIRENIVLVYSMENPKIAQVSSKGTVTGLSAGKTVLNIEYNVDSCKKVDKIPITVKKATITIQQGTKTLKKGKSVNFTTKLVGVTGTVKWKTSNKKIATVSSTGKVTAKKKGTVTITAYIGNVKTTRKIKVQ